MEVEETVSVRICEMGGKESRRREDGCVSLNSSKEL